MDTETYDAALLGILQNEGQIAKFLDVVMGFLYRRYVNIIYIIIDNYMYVLYIIKFIINNIYMYIRNKNENHLVFYLLSLSYDMS